MTAGWLVVDDRFDGKSIPTSDFAGDDGQPDQAVLDALVGFRNGSVSRSKLLMTLASARLFVPVKAILDTVESTADGRQVEKDSHMATVSIQLPDGRRGLLAFTSVAALSFWDRDARPVAAWGKSAAAAAEGDGADALLVDYGSPHMFAVEAKLLSALAAADQLWEPVSDREIQEEVMAAVAEVAREHGCQFELSTPNGDADIRVAVLATPGLDVRQVLEQVAPALAANDVLRARLVKGVELGVRTP